MKSVFHDNKFRINDKDIYNNEGVALKDLRVNAFEIDWDKFAV